MFWSAAIQNVFDVQYFNYALASPLFMDDTTKRPVKFGAFTRHLMWWTAAGQTATVDDATATLAWLSQLVDFVDQYSGLDGRNASLLSEIRGDYDFWGNQQSAIFEAASLGLARPMAAPLATTASVAITTVFAPVQQSLRKQLKTPENMLQNYGSNEMVQNSR